MDISAFAIWKFRYIEGFLRHMRASDVDSTKYIDPKTGLETWIHYDYKNETAKVVTPELDSVDTTFNELPAVLKSMHKYEELPEEERHHLAGQQKQE